MALASTKALVQQTNKLIDKMVYGQYVAAAAEYDKIAKVGNAPKGAGFTEGEISGLGPLLEKKEGAAITYDIPTERSPVTRTPTMFALGFQYPIEMLQDELFGNIKKCANSLGRSAGVKPDTAFWDLFNNGFATHTAWDGNYIFVKTGRTLLKDTSITQNNRPTTDASPTETSIQAALDYFNSVKTAEGFPALMRPRFIITRATGSANWAVKAVLRSDKKPGSMDNDINTVKDTGLNHFQSRFLTADAPWFVLADEHDFQLMWKMKMTKNNTDDFATGNFMHNVMERFMVFCNDPAGCYGTTGA